jgi:hypothetical protein
LPTIWKASLIRSIMQVMSSKSSQQKIPKSF